MKWLERLKFKRKIKRRVERAFRFADEHPDADECCHKHITPRCYFRGKDLIEYRIKGDHRIPVRREGGRIVMPKHVPLRDELD